MVSSELRFVLAMTIGFGLSAGSAVGGNRLANGSFEEGQESPAGWRSIGEAQWVNGGKLGSRCVEAKASGGAGEWISDAVALDEGVAYRLEGWIDAGPGNSRIVIERAAANDAAEPLAATPLASQTDGWRYVAIEWRPKASQDVHVRCTTTGSARWDGVSLHRADIPFLGNGGFDPDSKGRLGLWDEEKSSLDLTGRRGGRHEAEKTNPRTGDACAKLIPTADWYAIASVNYPVMAWTESIDVAAWVRCDSSAQAKLFVLWTSSDGDVLRVDAGSDTNDRDWRRLRMYQVAVDPHGKASEPSSSIRILAGGLFPHLAQSAVDFFYVQRCGCEVPGWPGPCHLDDARLRTSEPWLVHNLFFLLATSKLDEEE